MMICLNSMHNNSLSLFGKKQIFLDVWAGCKKKGINNRKLYLPTSECTLRQGRIEFPFGNSKWRLLLCKSTSSYLIFHISLSLFDVYMHAWHILCVDANNGQLREKKRKKGSNSIFLFHFLGCLLKGLGTSSAGT